MRMSQFVSEVQGIIATLAQALPDDNVDDSTIEHDLDVTPDELISEGCDPAHARYIAGQHLTARFAEAVIPTEEFQAWNDRVAVAEDEYRPTGPPRSPLTPSFFWSWALFDLKVGKQPGTVIETLIELVTAMEAPEELIEVLQNLSRSRMGIYKRLEGSDDFIVLQELLTGRELKCHVPTRYKGEPGELWFVRLLPPLSSVSDHFVAMTPPYVLLKTSWDEWESFLERYLPDGEEMAARLAALFKYEAGNVDWLEYVLQAHFSYRFDAILLIGIPDRPDSLRHYLHRHPICGPKFESEEKLALPPVRLTLTGPQRQIIAELCPELRTMVASSKKKNAVIALTPRASVLIRGAARAALSSARGARIRSLRKLLEITDYRFEIEDVEQFSEHPDRMIYELKIELLGTDPVIWRRIQVTDLTLTDLHYAIQAAMGWECCHVYDFSMEDEQFRRREDVPDRALTRDVCWESDTTLSSLATGRPQVELLYTYDYGDCWVHRVVLERVLVPAPRMKYPRCVDGARCCPPEDVGGLYGYEILVDAVSNPDMADETGGEWPAMWGDDFDPDEFDAATTTTRMQEWLDEAAVEDAPDNDTCQNR